MPEVSLHDRLRRMRRPEPADAGPALAQLERTLLGEPEDDLSPLSLKERLERLVAVAARRGARRNAVVPLEDVVDGHRVQNTRGEFFLLEHDVHLESRHGDVPLSRLRILDTETPFVLTGDPDLAAFDLSRAVFLDTETTGLAGGTGTAAFLIGIGYVEGDRFRVRQYFMRDYHEEAALLDGLASDLRRFDQVVTYNGKMFDLPLLESRYRLNRDVFPLSDAVHLDMLHPARRLWKARLESCRLQALETALLGLHRQEDVPGDQIPRIYFDYVRRRDPRALPRVFEHNRLDVVSLAAVAVLASQWVQDSMAEDPVDVLSLARVLERARLFERAEGQYRRALDAGPGPHRGPALLRLAWRARRAADHDAAVALWEQAAAEGELEAWRALAIHHEHRSRDVPAALHAVGRGLALLARSDDDPRGRRIAERFKRREARLLRKTGDMGKGEGVGPATPGGGDGVGPAIGAGVRVFPDVGSAAGLPGTFSADARLSGRRASG
jgi:uncharacterized protein YprB with RNaseH-like and TPR domain